MVWSGSIENGGTCDIIPVLGNEPRSLLVCPLAGSALYLLPGLAANISPRLWAAQRNYWLAGSRLVSMALSATQLATSCSAEGPAALGLLGESPMLCLLWKMWQRQHSVLPCPACAASRRQLCRLPTWRQPRRKQQLLLRAWWRPP